MRMKSNRNIVEMNNWETISQSVTLKTSCLKRTTLITRELSQRAQNTHWFWPTDFSTTGNLD